MTHHYLFQRRFIQTRTTKLSKKINNIVIQLFFIYC
nr:MAG TPA: hypothetical protein [Caudoviricetes sp.]